MHLVELIVAAKMGNGEKKKMEGDMRGGGAENAWIKFSLNDKRNLMVSMSLCRTSRRCAVAFGVNLAYVPCNHVNPFSLIVPMVAMCMVSNYNVKALPDQLAGLWSIVLGL